MIKLGTGYDLWTRVVDKTLSSNKLDKFLTVTDEAKKDPLLICMHFLPSWDPLTSTQLASNNRPVGPSRAFNLMTTHKPRKSSKICSAQTACTGLPTTTGYTGHIHIPATW